jgi:hypothetical protein
MGLHFHLSPLIRRSQLKYNFRVLPFGVSMAFHIEVMHGSITLPTHGEVAVGTLLTIWSYQYRITLSLRYQP